MCKSLIGRRAEILAADRFQAVPVTVAGSEIVRAGMPLKSDGTPSPDGSGAAGILLYDVNPAVNPNAAAVVQGIVNWSKCQENSGASAAAETMRAALPGIVFRENVGVCQAK